MLRRIILSCALISVIAAPPAFAQKYSIQRMTPEVEKALDARRDRFSQLEKYKSQGVVGENNRGYVEVLKDNGGAKGLVNAENKDRKIIYRTIAEQNNLGGQLETIEKVFAQVQREKAGAGEMVQQENGKWVKK